MGLTKQERDDMLRALKTDEEKVVTDFVTAYNAMLEEMKTILDNARPPESGLVSDAYIQMSSVYNNVAAYKASAAQLEQKHGKQDQTPV